MTVNTNHARNENVKNELQRIEDGGFCPFCSREYLENEHPNPILEETKHWIVTENRWPYDGAKVHLLFINTEHLIDVSELSQEAWVDLSQLLDKYKKHFRVLGGTLMLRHGDTRYTGATVEHLHAQFICGDPDDPEAQAVLARVG